MVASAPAPRRGSNGISGGKHAHVLDWRGAAGVADSRDLERGLGRVELEAGVRGPFPERV